jgi:hypothetical protein
MFVNQIFYNIKSGVDTSETDRLWEEIANPIYKKIPGLLSIYTLKCTGSSENESSFKWDYVFVEVWESEEAAKNALGKFIGFGDSELGRTGIYDKVLATFDKYVLFSFEVISSLEK